MTAKSALRRESFILLVALLSAMLVGSLLILLYGQSPGRVYLALLRGTWFDFHGIGQVLFKTTPLILTGLSVAYGLRAGLFNIGAPGQLLMGCFLCALVGAWLPVGTPAVLAILLCVLAAGGGGALVGALPGWLKARFGAHEVINTIMLNFIVSGLVLWCGNEFFFVGSTTHTLEIVDGARMPNLGIPGSAANGSLFVAILATAAVWFYLKKTRGGFEHTAQGQSLLAAENAGVRIGRTTLFVMMVSGALAGLVGVNYVLGYKHYFEQGMGSEVGFIGIAVALLGRGHPLGVVFAALFFGTLSQGGLVVSSYVPKDLMDVVQAVTILAVVMTTAAVQAYERGRR